MEKGKTHITDQELADEALRRAKEDPLWAEFTEKTPLEFCGGSFQLRMNGPKPLVRHNFFVVARVEYGGNEGIYAHIYMSPDPRADRRDVVPGGSILNFRTLSAGKEDFLNMHLLAGLIAYHAGKAIEDNIDRFN